MWISEPNFGDYEGDARHWLKAMAEFLFPFIELFSESVRFRSYEAKCIQLGCFHRGRRLCT